MEPAAETVTELPNGSGEVEAILDTGLNGFNVKSSLTIQITPAHIETPGRRLLSPFLGRVLYDTPSYDSRVELRCVPVKGKSCVPNSQS